jgi:PAS domain S-box-containing protein
MNADHTPTDSQLLDILFLSPNATAVYTSDDIIVRNVNQAMLSIWGKDRSVIGTPLAIALPELAGQPFIEILQKVWRSGITYRAREESAVLFIDGKLQTYYFDFVYEALKDDQDKVYCILHTASDVTERVLNRTVLSDAAQSQEALLREQEVNEELASSNEQLSTANDELKQIQENLVALTQELEDRVKRRTMALAESEAKANFLLNAIPQQIWTATPEGKLDYVNQIVSDDFGFPDQAILAEGWNAFIHPEDLNASLATWKTAIETGNEYMVEFRLRFKNGDYIWHLARAVPLVEEGKIKLWLGTNTNIAFQKSNEQKKDEFLSIASHELKTPLTSIKAFNQLMLRTKDERKQSEFLVKSSENILRLERLISDLLDVTKINAGKMNYNIAPFSFGTLLKDSIENVQHTHPSHQIIIENLVDITYTGDQFRLEQVMQNFLSNAIKYSPAAKRVVVNSKIELDNIIVSVQDFGIGIAEDNLDRLFDRYYRVDNKSMQFEGLGLGLFISSEILKRHHGSFWIESERDKGSTFFFRLPLPDSSAYKPMIRTDTFYQDEYITVTYNESEQRLDADWTGFQNMDSVKHGCMIMLKMLDKRACYKIVNDNSHVLGTWSEASEWVGETFFKRLEETGIQYLAWVFSPSVFSQLSAKKSIDVYVGEVTTQFFTEVALAEAWINDQAIQPS